jgi:hypothetical protein
LVNFTVNLGLRGGTYNCRVRLLRDSSVIGVGAGSGSRTQSTLVNWSKHTEGNLDIKPYNMQILDSPSTSSAVTYKLQWADNYGETKKLNYSYTDSNSNGYDRTVSHLTLMEVSA